MAALEQDFIHGDSERIFLNTELGCASSCSYCYLPSLGMPLGNQSATKRTSGLDVARALKEDPRFVKGPSGTILSIGCFSECWDKRNRQDTVDIVAELSPLANPIQLATKRKIDAQDFELIANACPDIKVFISSATINYWKTYEAGTSPPAKRFLSFQACCDLDVQCFLYIKPVIAKVTILDVDRYARVMDRYGVGVVVGDRFELSNDITRPSPISSKLNIIDDVETHSIRTTLASHGLVYRSSIEAMQSTQIHTPNKI